jgi:hypothetical protein
MTVNANWNSSDSNAEFVGYNVVEGKCGGLFGR